VRYAPYMFARHILAARINHIIILVFHDKVTDANSFCVFQIHKGSDSISISSE
jgi:hypothetical protein